MTKSATAHPIARAIDVGYGNTKFTTADADDDFNCVMFPSYAPTARKELAIAGGILGSGEYVHVDVDGKTYAVGKDAHLSASGDTSRVLDLGFALTNDYLALVRGALYYMAEPKIDMLVLGLPLNTYADAELREKMRQRITGGHTLPNPAHKKNKAAPSEFSVQVGAVRILPQPVGAFFNYCVPRGLYDQFNAQTNLVIDIGHGTVDWFVAEGNRPINAKCGAYFGGVSQVVKNVADAISPTTKENLRVMERIDKAIRTGELASIKDKQRDIRAEFKTVIDDTVRKAVSAMMSHLVNLDDIENILVTGGGAASFKDEIQKALPDRQLIIDDEPIFSNVRGFQICGEQWADSLKAAA